MKKAYSYIRYSTAIQKEGDSERRQKELAEKYVKDHGLILDTTLNMLDSGKSAYHGINRTKGALGQFLKEIEKGKIERGSVFLVEHLDRLSREEVNDAYDQFRSILKAGVKIVTLQDGTEYTKDGNLIQLLTSIIYMSQANQESEKKSIRLKASWENKRQQARNGERKMTAKAPDWLILSDDKKEFKTIDEAKQVINLIFDMKLEGKGSERIAKELNQSNLWKPNGRKNKLPSWRKSYIDKLLRDDRRLIGEHQLFRLVEGKRIKLGEPIHDYPAIIDLTKFDRVQAQIKRNLQIKGFAGGQNGRMNNLFSPLAVCSVCGSPMTYLNKGLGSKGGQYYQCDKEKRNIEGGCTKKMIRYDIVEENILTFCKGLVVADIMPNDQVVISELGRYQKRLLDIHEGLVKLELNMKNSVAAVIEAPTDSLRRIYEQSTSMVAIQMEVLVKEKKDVESQINLLDKDGNNTTEQLKNIQELIENMKDLESQQRLEIRLNLRNHLRRLIKSILINTQNNSMTIYFQSGQRRAIRMNEDGTTRIRDAYPMSIME